MTVKERFLKYISVPSQSAHDVETVPTTPRQWDMAKLMEKELKSVGLEDVRVSDHCYVYGVLPATEGYEDVPAIGFIAHMDTSPDFSDEGVHPQIIENYDGGAVTLGESGLVQQVGHLGHHAEADQVRVGTHQRLPISPGGELRHDILDRALSMIRNRIQDNAGCHIVIPLFKIRPSACLPKFQL